MKEEEIKKSFKPQLDLLIFRGMCFFGHKWAQWERQNIKIQYIKNGNQQEGYGTIQTRNCLRCNKMQKEDVCTF